MKTLIAQQLNVAFNLSALKWYMRHDKKKIALGALIALLVVVSLAPLFMIYLNMIKSTFNGGLSFGQPEIVLTLGLVMVSLIVLVFGIAFVMSTFYFSRDLPVLIPLPFYPREIIGAKFMVVLVQEYLTVIPLFLPVLIIYGLGMGVGPYYWVAGLLVMLMVPVMPLTLISAAVLVMMRATNLGKRKDFLRLLGMSGMVVVILAFNFFITKLAPMSQQQMMELLFADEGLVRFISRIFPPALVATRALTAVGLPALINLLFFAALTGAGVLITLYLGDRLFFRGLIGGEEVTARRDISADKLEKRMTSVSSPAWAIAVREIKMLFRTPIYLFNSVGVLLIAPIAMVLPLIAGDTTDPLLQMLQQTDARLLINLAGAGLIGMMAAITPAASSTFSREGKQFWISQIIPVPPAEQIKGKFIYSLLLSALAIPLVFLISALITKWTAGELLFVIVVGMCISVPSIAVSLLIDLVRPYLNWDNPQKAIKQNINVIFGMLATGGIYYILYLLTMYLYRSAYSDWLVYAGIAAAALVIGMVFYLSMLRIADERYRNIFVP